MYAEKLRKGVVMYLFQNGPTSNCLKSCFHGKMLLKHLTHYYTHALQYRENNATFEETLAQHFKNLILMMGLWNEAYFA